MPVQIVSETTFEWLLDHVAYGRLDEMPYRHLFEIMSSRGNAPAVVAAAAKQIDVPDDIEQLLRRCYEIANAPESVPDLETAAAVSRSWAILEGFRRLGYVRFHSDVLIRELGDVTASKVEWISNDQVVRNLRDGWTTAISVHAGQFVEAA